VTNCSISGKKASAWPDRCASARRRRPSADEKPINESGSVRLKTEFSGGAQDEAARGIIVHVMRLTQVAQRRVAATAAMLPQRRLARSGKGFRHLWSGTPRLV